MKAEDVLEIRAGSGARRLLADEGLQPAQLRVMVGASGGPKWLVLSGLDRFLAREFFPKIKHPVHLLGSSAGSWRMCCYAQRDALAALQRFEQVYIEQSYSEKPTAREISDTAVWMLNSILGDTGVQEILEHPTMYLNVVAVRARHLLACDSRMALYPGLLMAAVANLLHRRLLGWFFERAIFCRPGEPAHFHQVSDLPTRLLPLFEDNLRQALLASGSIPGLLAPVKNLAGAPAGSYYDGGVTDYHFDLPFHDAGSDGLVFYPHFYGHIKPGWFDKALHWRGHTSAHYDNVLLIAPSRQFVSSLPDGRIPDRKDFFRYENPTRIANWKTVIAESERMADAFAEVLETQRFAELALPL